MVVAIKYSTYFIANTFPITFKRQMILRWFHTHVYSCSTSHYQQRWKIPPRFSSNSEALASELLENLGRMFPCYNMNNDTFSKLTRFKHSLKKHNMTSQHKVCFSSILFGMFSNHFSYQYLDNSECCVYKH